MVAKTTWRIATLLAGLVAAVACSQGTERAQEVVAAPTAEATATPVAGRHLTALAGGGQDTVSINGFFPSRLTVRAGDTVTWRLNSDETRTVTFLGGTSLPALAARNQLVPVPGGSSDDLMLSPVSNLPTRRPGDPVEVFRGEGMVSSGALSRDPMAPGLAPNDSFYVMFDRPGTYEFVDLNHPSARGSVVVIDGDGQVDDQAAIDVRAGRELDPAVEFADQMIDALPLLGDIRHLSTQYLFSDEFLDSLGPYSVEDGGGDTIYRQPLPDGSDVWFVQTSLGPDEAKLLEFIPRELTLRVGDTVSWNSPAEAHTVVFDPVPPPPEFIELASTKKWPPEMLVNPMVALTVKPTDEYDPTQFYSSGLMGFEGAPGGKEFRLTFNTVGTFKYFCAIHRELGMEGTIRVIAYSD